MLISLQKGEAISQFHGYRFIVEIEDTKITKQIRAALSMHD